MRRRLLRSAITIALVATLMWGSSVLACGPFSLDTIFVYTVHPAFPLEEFAKGNIGVVQPSYARSYLYVAYRHLNNLPFTAREQKSLVELWDERLNTGWNLGEENWIKEWLAARGKVAGLPEPAEIDVYRHREKPDEYETYLNCQKDAFDSAISTLNSRIAKFGVDSADVRAWIGAQDQVFANCSEGQHIPAPAPAESNQVFAADRAYQIAAANFYAGNFDEARKGFEAIASDRHSQWQPIAPYLIARTLIRKASLGTEESKKESLSQAEAQLTRILIDQDLSATHAAANRLLDLVKNRLYPKRRLNELAEKLTGKNEDASLKQDLWDYTLLLDQFLESDSGEAKTVTDDELLSNDLTNWIAAIEDQNVTAKQRVLDRWQKTHSQAWLIAAMTALEGNEPQVDDLISQATKIRPDSPAFPSSRFHAARLLVERGRTGEARTLLDQLLKENRSVFDQSSWNQLVALRMKLADSLGEFLSYAPRVPASFSWNDDGREIPTGDSEVPDETKGVVGKPLFDREATIAINRTFPLSVLKEAATVTTLPVHLRRDLVQAVWLRAVLLGDYKTADELAPVLKGLVPELSKFLNDFTAATQPDEKKFAAIYAWLKFPGMEPVVDFGIGRQMPLSQQDTYRDNWWCSGVYSDASDTEQETSSSQSAPAKKTWIPAFLSEAETSRGAREVKALVALGAAPNYLCRQVVQWGTRNRNDSRVPEALHLAVKSTRYGCTDKETGRWSKAAFDLLHARYPTSTWAKQTPYWFKD